MWDRAAVDVGCLHLDIQSTKQAGQCQITVAIEHGKHLQWQCMNTSTKELRLELISQGLGNPASSWQQC